ncbi:MAG: peptidase C69 [Actinobacteria bacterium HGW-Actinobacteria-10]|nr:MAG: peptidase C69 [Actinobacteria bacterium HGW-Actinobacteria-10]
MRETIEAALEAARLAGATYADARIVDTVQESVSVENGRVEGVESSASFGIGVRVIADGAWGFASNADVTRDSAILTARQAVAVARASALVAAPAPVLAPVDPVQDTWSGTCEIDPFKIPLEDKLALLTQADEIMRSEPHVKLTKANYSAYRVRKFFGSSEGSYITQEHTETGGGIVAYAINEGEVLPRSYPNSHGGAWKQAGWEYVLELDLAGNAPRVAEQAAALITARECPSGEMDLIIDASQMALQVHESIGHPTELDRVLGDEAAFAGTSWVRTSDLDTLHYGSEHVNITADATIPGSLGAFGYDDEGVPAQREYLVRDGILTGFLSSRESAASLERTSSGAMRADGWNRIPLIRMTTVSLEPGTWGFDDLIADTKRGLYIETNNSWSIDDKRLNFQFATEIGWLIENGELTTMVKSPNYTGITPEFWGSCDAVCSQAHWSVWGIPNCGKGEPMQVAHVAHGASPARFRNVTVGVGR